MHRVNHLKFAQNARKLLKQPITQTNQINDIFDGKLLYNMELYEAENEEKY